MAVNDMIIVIKCDNCNAKMKGLAQDIYCKKKYCPSCDKMCYFSVNKK